MGRSFFECEAISKCALVETTFLLLVTVSTVNLLTTVLNDAPILPDEDSEDTKDNFSFKVTHNNIRYKSRS